MNLIERIRRMFGKRRCDADAQLEEAKAKVNASLDRLNNVAIDTFIANVDKPTYFPAPPAIQSMLRELRRKDERRA